MIRKIRTGTWVKDPTRIKKRKRKEYYDGDVKVNLIKIWKTFDLPCGQVTLILNLTLPKADCSPSVAASPAKAASIAFTIKALMPSASTATSADHQKPSALNRFAVKMDY